MSNEHDPWHSLANDLGVDPAAMPPQSQSAPPPSPPPRTPSSAPPKKSQPGWSSLAAEFGIEITEESSPSTSTPGGAGHDFVAELLGFPPPQARPAEQDQPEGEESGRREKVYRDDYWHDQIDEAGGEQSETQSGERTDRRDEYPARDGGRPEKRGRRRRGGRGRRDDRRESSERIAEEAIFAEEIDSTEEAEPAIDFSDEGAPLARTDENEQSPRSRGRRRRGGRGRGRRDDRSGHSEHRAHHRRPDDDRPVSREVEDELDVDFERVTPLDDDVLAESPLGAVPAEIDEADDDSHETRQEGKSSVRDIMTWQQAISMIIDVNMQTRSQAPRHSQRGRGRGHGRHRRD